MVESMIIGHSTDCYYGVPAGGNVPPPVLLPPKALPRVLVLPPVLPPPMLLPVLLAPYTVS
jgi:hypothetical protein